MNQLKLILALVTLSFTAGFSQTAESFFLNRLSDDTTPNNIFYYPFNDGVQLIEIDYITGYNWHLAQYHDKGYVPPYSGKKINEYLFRDSLGEIIKSYNVDGSIDSIKCYCNRQTLSTRKITTLRSGMIIISKGN
jgi:hypothetical protein